MAITCSTGSWSRRRSRTGVLGLLLFNLVLLAGCGEDDDRDPAGMAREYVGRIDGTEAYIGIATFSDDFAVAYVCDGADVAWWLIGQIDANGDLDMEPDGARHLVGTAAAGVASGMVTLGGQSRTFQALEPQANAGFYGAADSVDGLGYEGGWILLADGTQRGAVVSGGTVVSNPTLTPSSGSVQLTSGSSLIVDRIGSWSNISQTPWFDPIAYRIRSGPTSGAPATCQLIAADGVVTRSERETWESLACGRFYTIN
jgi:hypothetical protein